MKDGKEKVTSFVWTRIEKENTKPKVGETERVRVQTRVLIGEKKDVV